jgi:hypothetical protein
VVWLLLGPLSVDAYLPAFDNIRSALHTDTQPVQYTLSAYLFSFAALPWTVTPIFFYAFGMSLAAPGLTLSVLELFPSIRGVVASMQAFTMVMPAALVTRPRRRSFARREAMQCLARNRGYLKA